MVTPTFPDVPPWWGGAMGKGLIMSDKRGKPDWAIVMLLALLALAMIGRAVLCWGPNPASGCDGDEVVMLIAGEVMKG